VRRRSLGLGGIALCIVLPALGACAPGQAASAPEPTEVPAQPTQAPAYVTQVQLTPPEPRLGQDENVVIRANFRTRDGRPVSGAQLQAVVNYPGGAQTFTSEQTTFQDGRLDFAVPVQPTGRQVPRGTQVRMEIVMRYQGQEYRSNSGFTVR
jgi:hypothetical protein